MKITHQLSLGGWLQTQRGKGGGIRLGKPPAAIPLGAVVRTMEPDFFIVECFSSGNTCTLTGDCAVTGVIDVALQRFMAHLDAQTLADVLPAAPGLRTAKPLRFQRAPKSREA